MIELSFPLVLMCLAAGALLIALEIFVTPGLGVKGILGLLLVAAAVIIAYTEHGPVKGSITLGLAVLVLVGGGWIAKVTVGRRLVLRDAIASDVVVEEELSDLVGQEGLSASMLRPTGIARFGDRRVDVTADAEFIEPGTPIVVTGVEGNKVLVKRKS